MYNLRGVRRGLPAAAALFIAWLAAATFVHGRYADEPGVTRHDVRYWNGETALHFLNILGRYAAAPVSSHWFAPSAPCTAGPETPCVRSAAADLPGTAVVSSARLGGEAVYTSFPPGAMVLMMPVVLPMAAALDMAPLVALRLCNLVLALLTCLLWLRLLDRLLAPDLPARTSLLVAGTMPLLLSVEVLHSHHVSMWSHQVYQPVFVLLLLAALGEMTSRRAALTGALAALACWVEWAAFLACVAMLAVVFVRSPSGMRWRNGLVFGGTAVCGGLTLLLYYALLLAQPVAGGWWVGLERYFTSLLSRVQARSFLDERHRGTHWFETLADSWWPWLHVCLLLLVALLWSLRTRAALHAGSPGVAVASTSRWLAALAIVALPLGENMLLTEHAIGYTFDRLKWGFLFALSLAWAGERLACAHGPVAAHAVLGLSVLAGGAAVVHLVQLYVPYW